MPGVFRPRPFVHEPAWRPYLLNGPTALFMTVDETPERLAGDDRTWFLRPVDDSKELPGGVKTSREIVALARQGLALEPHEIPIGALRHDAGLMLTRPARILKEWRCWVVNEKVVTYSLHKEGRRGVYRPEIDADALSFARRLVAL